MESRHAYLIFAHTNPSQLELLLRLLDDPLNDIYLHIDPAVSAFNRERMRAAVKQGTLSIYSLHHLAWGGENLIDVILSLLREAQKTEHLYYHLLSGMDLPLKPQSEIHAFFQANAELEYLDFDAPSVSDALLADRLQTYHFFQSSREKHPAIKSLDCFLLKVQRKLGVNRLKHAGFPLQKGSLWFSITHAFAAYCVAHAAEIRPCFRFSKCGDELFFQTLLLNSPFLQRKATATFNDDRATMRFIDWDRGNGTSPYVFRAGDYDRILQSGMLFARKFDERVDAEIIARIAAQSSVS